MTKSFSDLETDRLLLKEVTEDHVSDYEKYFVNYEIISQLTSKVPWPYPKGGVEEWLKINVFPFQGTDKWVWGIFLKENPEELIGAIDLRRKNNPDNRGFWLGKEFWGRGIMTEAVAAVNDYAFDCLGFERLIFSNAKGNDRSRRVKEKTGARFLRTEAAKFVSPDLTESEIWELTKHDWEKFRVNNAS